MVLISQIIFSATLLSTGALGVCEVPIPIRAHFDAAHPSALRRDSSNGSSDIAGSAVNSQERRLGMGGVYSPSLFFSPGWNKANSP
jgi:hypothetical protein